MPGLEVGEIVKRDGILIQDLYRRDAFEGFYFERIAGPVNIRWTASSMRGGKDPDVASIIQGDHGIIMGIAGTLVHDIGRPAHHTRFMIEISHSMQE